MRAQRERRKQCKNSHSMFFAMKNSAGQGIIKVNFPRMHTPQKRPSAKTKSVQVHMAEGL